MKILLIGEFSGVHNNLKKGLQAQGHEVKIAASGDGYKGFGYDFHIAPYQGKVIGKLLNIATFLINLRKFTGYDVIQLINPFSVPYYFHIFGLTRLLFKFNGKKIYYVCGTDSAFINAKSKFKYFPFDDPNSPEYPHYSHFKSGYYNWFIKHIDCIVPSMYSYAVGYSGNTKLAEPIPLPGSGEYIDRIRSINSKIKILHGITRRNFKGSVYILKALYKIQKKYPKKVEITIVEGLPFSEYKKNLEKSDILIDQCKSYDYGMNAIFALEKGIIVLSGAEKIAISYLSKNQCPVINILPDVENIVRSIQDLVNEGSLLSTKQKSLEYCKIVHNVKKVSNLFELCFKKR